MVKALTEKGFAYFVKEDFEKAENNLINAIAIQAKLNDEKGMANLYSNLASIYRGQGKFIETIKYYNYSLKIFQETKEEVSEATLLSNLGLVYNDLKNIEIALYYYEKSLIIYEKLNLQDKIGYIDLYIGAIDFENNNYKASIHQAEKALSIFKEVNNLLSSIDCYILLAKAHQKLNETDKAFECINQSLELCKKLNLTSKIIESQSFIAELLIESDIKKATQIGENLLPIIDSISDKKIKANFYNLLFKCYKKQNKIELSHAMYDKYILYNDSIIKELSNLELMKEAVNQEFKMKLSKAEQNFQQSEKDLKRNQFIKLTFLVILFLLIVSAIYYYARKKIISNRKIRDELLEEIKKLKSNDSTKIVVNSTEFQLNREKIEAAINRKLNETDWNILNILLKEPEIANKEIAEKAFMSIDGIGSSLRRMYLYFDIKESKYKKISLIMEAIKASS